MSLARNRTGDELLAFYPGHTLVIPDDLNHLPLIFAAVIAIHQGEILFTFNAWRQEWELPAGLIEPGETPLAAAQRELAEESGQVAHTMTYTGLILLRLPNGNLEMGAAYRAEIETLRPFQHNDEAIQMMLWDRQRPVAGYVNAIAQALCRLAGV